MEVKNICGVIAALCVAAIAARADSLVLKNGSLIKGKFTSGCQTSITFQVGSSVQTYSIGDIRSLQFDSEAEDDLSSIHSKERVPLSATGRSETAGSPGVVTIPAGTQISVRTIDAIDSSQNGVGYRFEASLEQPFAVDGIVVVPKHTDVYGRLEESKEAGTFAGRAELRLELTGIVVQGQTLPLVTGEYGLSGKSKGESTAKRAFGGAAIGSIIGAVAGGGKGAAVGAGTGAGVGAASEIITKGDRLRIPSETLLEFTLEQSVVIPNHPAWQ
ncbi:MAG: hypothetical protein WB679_15300 [Terracidiphilus sp.]